MQSAEVCNSADLRTTPTSRQVGAPPEASVCGDRVTHGSSYSFQPGVVTSLRGLDDQLTNSLFELHGLMGGGRPSTNRVSFGGDRCDDVAPAQPHRWRSIDSTDLSAEMSAAGGGGLGLCRRQAHQLA